MHGRRRGTDHVNKMRVGEVAKKRAEEPFQVAPELLLNVIGGGEGEWEENIGEGRLESITSGVGKVLARVKFVEES